MPVTIDHIQLQAALKEFGIKEHDYYLLFDTNLYIVWCTTGAKALQLVTENSCATINYMDEWYYFNEIPSNYVVPSYVCVRCMLEFN